MDVGLFGNHTCAGKMPEGNWGAYDRFRKVEEPAFLRMAREIVYSMDPPREVKEGGRPAIDVKNIVLCCLFEYKFKYDYWGLVSHFDAHEDPEYGYSTAIEYSVKKINGIKGCREISGKKIKVNGFSFLGLRCLDVYRCATFKPIVRNFSGKVDIVVSHCCVSTLPAVSNLKPKLIINGHSRSGKVLVKDVPVVLTNGLRFVLIEFKNKRLSSIQEYEYPWIKLSQNCREN